VFQWLMQSGAISAGEMLRTFNCGTGMVVVVAADRVDAVEAVLLREGETVARIGRLGKRNGEAVVYQGQLSL
ncbi:MAG: phosphoribosylformylglycinamidine cyclo-ligase, partial [Nitratireductor sp.]|nr:phosphoribosylformylglycinamidine cyclo-ligase [Nitratireductor sp.]